MPDGLGKERQLRFWRTKPVARGGFPAVSLAVILMTIGAAADSGQKEPPQIELHQAACGALLRDDFESGAINRNLWSVSVEDPGIRVTVQEGELCIRGKSVKIPKAELYRKEVKLWRFAGLTSRPFSQTDVSLAVRVKMPSGIAAQPGLHGVCIHLCGVSPDTYPEVLFGKVEGKAAEEVLHEFAQGTPDDVPYPDARGWFLGIINQEHGDKYYQTSFSYIDSETREERFVSVPEEGGRNLISTDPLAPGSVYTASVDDQGKLGLFRLEVGCSTGTGKLRTSGGIDSDMKEAIQRAFAYVQGHKVEMGIGQSIDTTDFHVEAIDLLGNHVSCEAGVALVVAIYSAVKKRRTRLLSGVPYAGGSGWTEMCEPCFLVKVV